MREKFKVLVWRLTGWVPGDWSRRDCAAMYRYWAALVEVRDALAQGDKPWAEHIIKEALS